MLIGLGSYSTPRIRNELSLGERRFYRHITWMPGSKSNFALLTSHEQIWTFETSGGFPSGSDGKESAWIQSLSQEDPLEKEMATHSSILAWRIPWTEEPGGLQSMGLQSQT